MRDTNAVKYTLTFGWTETTFLNWTCFYRQWEAFWKRLPSYSVCGIDACNTEARPTRMPDCGNSVVNYNVAGSSAYGLWSITDSTVFA